MDKRKLINRSDFMLIGIVVILAFCIYALFSLTRTSGVYLQAEIRVDGRVVQTLNLYDDAIITLTEHPAIQFIVNNGRIAFYKSDCPDQICVRNGFLHLAGHMSVCLPNRVVLAVVSLTEDGDGIDIFLD